MTVLVVYGSRYGATARDRRAASPRSCASCGHQVDVQRGRRSRWTPGAYDAYVIGSAAYHGLLAQGGRPSSSCGTSGPARGPAGVAVQQRSARHLHPPTTKGRDLLADDPSQPVRGARGCAGSPASMRVFFGALDPDRLHFLAHRMVRRLPTRPPAAARRATSATGRAVDAWAARSIAARPRRRPRHSARREECHEHRGPRSDVRHDLLGDQPQVVEVGEVEHLEVGALAAERGVPAELVDDLGGRAGQAVLAQLGDVARRSPRRGGASSASSRADAERRARWTRSARRGRGRRPRRPRGPGRTGCGSAPRRRTAG